MASKLTQKQELFCKEYLVDLNATKAAKRAGYSAKTCASIGGENLQKPEIQERLQELIQKRSQRVEIDADWVLKQAVSSFEFNAQEVFDNEGNPKMVNATAAAKFLELTGKHTRIQAFEKEKEAPTSPEIHIHITDAKKPE